ncbi:MAG TPA: branched-chain amino acid ABC transporter permease [Bauldia sp.]|nr:branched-chain amino acid ABC transporter permease [Bauldia sp.]
MIAVSIILSGLILGGIYAMVALGLTLQYGVARIMNLAYGEFLVAAAFAAWWLYTANAVSPLAGLVVIVPLAFLVNWLVYHLLLMPLVRRAKSRDALEGDSILFTFGLLFVVQGVLLATFGGQLYSYSYLLVPVDILGTTVSANRLIAFLFAIVAGLALYLVLTRTRAGIAVRAVAVDPRSARLVGIDVPRVSAFAFALGGALAAAAGVLVSMFLTFSAGGGVLFTMKALIVVIMGGVGSLLGTLVAGLVLGLSEVAVARLVDPGLTLAVNFVIFLGVLLVRPTGLFGSSAR